MIDVCHSASQARKERLEKEEVPCRTRRYIYVHTCPSLGTKGDFTEENIAGDKFSSYCAIEI